MNKINPLYILIVSAVLFIFSIASVSFSNSKLVEVKEDNKQYMIIANKYQSLQKAWGTNSTSQDEIEKLLKSSGIYNANILKSGKSLKVNIQNTNIKTLDKFMNKVLNKTINIKSFSLEKSSLTIEVVL